MKKDSLAKFAFISSGTLMAFAFGVAVGFYEMFPFTAVKFGVDSVQEVWHEKETLSKIRPEHFLAPARFDGEGVTRINEELLGPGLTLLSGFFEDSNELRLVRADGTVVNRWSVSFSELFSNPDHIRPSPNVPATDWNVDLHGALAFPDGSVVFNFEYAGLVKLDRCGEVEWTVPRMTHHSVELSSDGGFWVGGRRYVESSSQFPPIVAPYLEDTIVKVSAEGEVLQEISLPGLLFKNGLQSLLLANGNFDVSTRDKEEIVHLNDIEELPKELEGHFSQFTAGDLLISTRNFNLIMVVEPRTETIKWRQTGPWIRQHDPDFTRSGRISVFNNNTDGDGGAVFGGSSIIEIDPGDRSFSVVYGEGPDQEFYTEVRGRHQPLDNGNMLIAEYGAGRVIEVTGDGQIVWEYINRYDEDEIAHINDAIRYPEGYFSVETWSCDNSDGG